MSAASNQETLREEGVNARRYLRINDFDNKGSDFRLFKTKNTSKESTHLKAILSI